MDKEDIGMEPQDNDETLKQDEEVASSTDNEEKDAKDIHEGIRREKTLEELKEENKILSDKMMRALAETENIRKKFLRKKDAEIYGGTKLARDLLSVLDNLIEPWKV